MYRPYLISWIGFSLIILSSAGCSRAPNYWVDAKPGQKKVLVSFPPLYAITHAVAGDHAHVQCLLSGQGPHDYDGAVSDLLKVKYADLFIWNGLTLDDLFADKIVNKNTNTGLKLLNVGEVLENAHHDLLEHSDGKEHDHGDGKMHKHGEHDPHVWLGPETAKAMAEIIAAKLAEIDPAHKKDYEANAKKLNEELDKLHAYGKTAFKDKKNKNIITNHEAFAYFAGAFGIKIVGVIQLRPGADPNGEAMKKLVADCLEHKVAVIAVEPQYPPNQAESLQRTMKGKGIDIAIVRLDPLETVTLPEGKGNPDPGFYLQKMRENIDTLAKALP